MTVKRSAAAGRPFPAICPVALTLALVLFAQPVAYSDDIADTASPESDTLLMDGEGVTVTAHKPATEPGIIRIRRDEIDRSTAPDIATLLADTAGIGMTSHGGYGTVNALSIRGLSTNRILVRIDGVAVSSPQSGDFDFTSVDKNSVESITISYGGTAAATVDITTRNKCENEFDWRAGLSNTAWLPPDSAESLFDTQRLDFSLGWSADPIRIRLNAFATRSENRFAFEQAGHTELRTGNEMVDAGINASAGLAVTRLVTLSVSGSIYRATKNVAGPINTVSDGEQQDFRSLEIVSLSTREFFSPRITASVTLSHSATDLTWEDVSTKSRHRLHSIEANSTVNLFPSDVLDVRFSTAWKHDILDSTNTGTVIRDTVTAEIGADYQVTRTIDATVNCTVLASPSLDTPQAMPSVTLSKAFGTHTRAGIKIYKTFKIPDMNALYWSGDATAEGNPDLKNEQAWGAEIFFTRSKNHGYRVEQSLWGLWYQDAIIWQSDTGIWRPENVGEAVYAGFDNRFVLTPGHGYTITLRYAWLFTRALTGDFTFSDGKRMPYQSEHRFSVRVDKSHKQYRWHIAPRYESSRYTTIMNATELPGVFLLDGGMTVQAGKNVVLYLDGRNLLNEQWMSMDGYPMPGRSVTAGIRIGGGSDSQQF